ncbi:hypothetical protein ACFL9T_06830 [Thermodesulfobacteriota bacterium]
MTEPLFFFRKKFWLTILKLIALGFVSAMLLVQIPELFYDLGPKSPLAISTPQGLSRDRIAGATFVSIEGKPDFKNAFIYRRYGLSYSYFTVEPYGMRLIARTHEEVTDEWNQLNRFMGKLRPFNRQPFHYRIRDIYQEKFQIDVPSDAFFLALDDVPKINGWQISAMVFAILLWLVMFYMFFLFGRRRSKKNI